MRVNVYAEEMTDRVEIISKEIDGHKFTGLRFYLELPVSYYRAPDGAPVSAAQMPGGYGPHSQLQGPFMHRPGDDDSSAVTFWGKRDLRVVLLKALQLLDEHYVAHGAQKVAIE